MLNITFFCILHFGPQTSVHTLPPSTVRIPRYAHYPCRKFIYSRVNTGRNSGNTCRAYRQDSVNPKSTYNIADDL